MGKTEKDGEQEGLDMFKAWMEDMTDDDYKQIVSTKGKLKRIEVAIGCSFSPRRLNQNSKVKEELAGLEDDLRERGILPKMTQKAKDDALKPKEYDQNTSKRVIDANKSSKLERENLELRMRIKKLEDQLERFTELSEVMTETGFIQQ